MSGKRACKALIGCCLLLIGLDAHGRSFSVATVGDSFADSLYYSMRARPDLVQQFGVRLVRWSRPMVGLTRLDYFDYVTWLRDSPELGAVDLCFVEIGSNDMQSIPVAKRQWIAYGSSKWKEMYAGRTLEMARVLIERRCGQALWVLQPGFEKRDAMACHRELIDEVQRETLDLDRTRVLEMVTSEADYGPDKTHLSRAYLLQLGPALFQLAHTACQAAHMGCLACHRHVKAPPTAAEIFPLRWWRKELATKVWAPAHAGIQCKTAVVSRVGARKWSRPRRRSR